MKTHSQRILVRDAASHLIILCLDGGQVVALCLLARMSESLSRVDIEG